MKTYLWDFSFEDLLSQELTPATWQELTESEKQIIAVLHPYFEVQAAIGRRLIAKVNRDQFAELLPQLMKIDMVLQLCLIFSVNVQESLCSKETICDLIESEVLDYFYEYRCFRTRYSFEAYSMMNQITPLADQMSQREQT